VALGAGMPEIIHEMSSKRLGMTCVVDERGRLAGVFTDGDLRRLFMDRAADGADKEDSRALTRDVLALSAGEVMTRSPVTVSRDALAVEALRVMEARKITSIVVVDVERTVEGVIHLHDLWRTQMF
jgi:arabinose-5-phosphate isomerase